MDGFGPLRDGAHGVDTIVIVTDLAGVLWDMDGTLVDTEPLWMRSEYALAAEYGAEWTEEDGLALVGRDLLDAAAYIRDRMQLPLTAPQIVERIVGEMVVALRENIPWRAGARELLLELHRAGIPLALVTMSYRVLADVVAAEVGVFSAVIAGDEARRPKPNPDPYLQGAEALGVPANRCVAFEDSATGARSAVAAGCATVVVQGYAQVDPELGDARWTGLTEATVDAVRELLADTVDA